MHNEEAVFGHMVLDQVWYGRESPQWRLSI